MHEGRVNDTFLPELMEGYNWRFAKEPSSDKNLHRPLGEHDQLDGAFSWKEERTVSNRCCLTAGTLH